MSLALFTAQEKAERRREKNRIRERNNLLKRKQRDSFTPEENEAHRARMRQYVHNRAQNDPLFMEAEAQRARRNREPSLVPEDRSDIPEESSSSSSCVRTIRILHHKSNLNKTKLVTISSDSDVESGDEDGDDDRSEGPNRRRLNSEEIAWERVRQKYESLIKKGCTKVCSCCGGLFFRKYCNTKATKEKLRNEWNCDESIVEMAFWLVDNSQVNTSNTTDANTTARFCDLCRDKIKQNIRPDLALADGLDFPETHCCLDDLTRLEERLVAARHVFQSIWTLHGNSGQYRSKGGIVNVPVNVDTTVSAFPRQLDDSFIIHLSLARRMRYLKDYIKGNISTAKVWRAYSFLQTQPLYVEHEIEFDDTWMESAMVEINCVGTDSDMSENEDPTNNTNENQNSSDNEAEVEEEEEEIEEVDQEN
ncbi:hypothetical protein INT47_007910, partial [Mucor saturninus]